MIFGRKKASAIDRRLQKLQREMAELGTEIKSLSRYEKAGDSVSGPSAGSVPLAGSESEAAVGTAASAGSSSLRSPSRVPGAADLSPREQESGKTSPAFTVDTTAAEGESDLPLFESRAPLSMSGREKFANYFMAGHFSNLRPLRQEKRIIRNKAIVMIVLVVLALVWLFFFLHNQ